MPDTLCQNCGNELQIESICYECRKPIQQICNQCGYATFEQIHLDYTLCQKCFLTLSKINQFVDDEHCGM